MGAPIESLQASKIAGSNSGPNQKSIFLSRHFLVFSTEVMAPKKGKPKARLAFFFSRLIREKLFRSWKKDEGSRAPGGIFVEKINFLSGWLGSLLLGYFRCLECFFGGVGRESLVSQPKISQHQEEEPPPEAPPEEEEPCSTRKAWVYGINNHVERLDADVVQAGDWRGCQFFRCEGLEDLTWFLWVLEVKMGDIFFCFRWTI